MELQNSTLDDLAAVIGFTATLRLAAWFGDGGNLYVPDKVEEGQLLVKLIGMSAAARMSSEWGQQHVAVPRLRSYEDDVRKRLVGRLLEKGFSSREIAGMERISERRVQQICRELESAGLIPIIGPAKKASIPGPEKLMALWPGEKAPEKTAGKGVSEKSPTKHSGKKTPSGGAP